MKSQKLKLKITVFVILFLSAITVMAQQRRGNYKDEPGNVVRKGCILNLPDLTEDQINKIEELRFDHRKEMLSCRTQLQENRAKINTLQIQESVNMDLINKLIEESGKIRTDMLKKKVAHQQKIRNLLTEKQRVIFDEHMIWSHNKMGRGRRHGFGDGAYRYRYNCPYNNTTN